MKKRIKALVSMLAAAVVFTLLPGGITLTVKAAEPTTYAVQYLAGDINQWRFITGSTFDATQAHMGADILPSLLKDGDSVVVYNGADKPTKELDLGTAKLNNLTVYQNATAIVRTGGIKDCYVLAGSYCAINGDVTNAYLYDNTTCTFNNNVLDMTLYTTDQAHSNISCAGTVGRFCIYSTTNDKKQNEFFNIIDGALSLKDGTTYIPYDKYSATPTAEYTQAMENVSAPAESAPNASESTPAPAGNASADSAADEYDSVPKTGDSNAYFWLFCASAVCFAGSYILRKKAN